MKQEIIPVHSIEYLTDDIIELSFISDHISSTARPGQFINIRVGETFPLLRRPFSIFSINGAKVSIVFHVIGTGTKLLAAKRPGETIDVIGPCGNDFLSFVDDSFDTAVFVGGGIGIAPFPFLTQRFPEQRRKITFIGGRTKNFLIQKGLNAPKIATDDGTLGMKGTVLDLIKDDLAKNSYGTMRFFVCGPTRMMKAVAEFAAETGSSCYASLECDMACGVGLCQGCNIEMIGGDKKYRLVCKEGTIFETRTVKL